MTRHGISHATATLITVVAAPILTEHLRQWLPAFVRFTDRLASLIVSSLELREPLTPPVVSTLLVAASLAFLWGAAFAAMQRARS